MNEHDGLAVPRPVLDTNADVRRIIQSGTGMDFSDEAASNRRLAGIEAESEKFKQVCREEAEIRAKSERLALAIIAGIERRPEPTGD
jgi:hypothetical protein